MSKQVKERIEQLSEELRQHNYNYYVLSKSEISDYDFDMLLKELQDLEQQFPEYVVENSPTQRVGGAVTKSFNTVAHKNPMLSLSNSYSKEELLEFDARVRKTITNEPIEYVCELKYDGVAIALTYINGRLVQALTRGDGKKGDDVIANVKTIRSIPLKLKGDFPSEFEIRGEVFMSRTRFEILNERLAIGGKEKFANPRNTASGTLKMQDSRVVANRKLDAYFYHVIEKGSETHYGNLERASKWGFKTPITENNFITKVTTIDAIFDFINYWDRERNKLDFDIDGVVVKVNSMYQQQMLGNTAKSPRWAIAYKFKTERAATILKKVTYQVGRTGAITPVANLQAVELGGTTVRRASLHNADQIAKLDVREGDTVFVEKGGEIIPKIVGVDLDARPANSEPLNYITVCPECNNELVRVEGESNHFCVNEASCPPQVKGKIEHFISRKALNIDGLGEETIEQLFNAGLIQNIADLYDLQKEDVLKLDRMAEKSVSKLLQGLEDSKKVPFQKVLFAIGIRHVGETVAQNLANHFKNVEKLKAANLEELIEVADIGGKIAESVINYFSNPDNNVIIERLKKAGLQFAIDESENVNSTDKLNGKSFVVSGVFKNFSRDGIKEAIKKNGGKLVSSVSSKTDYLLAGDKIGPSKLSKAEKLGVTILSEQEFIEMIG
jgi:DNA ligase (NAD+)